METQGVFCSQAAAIEKATQHFARANVQSTAVSFAERPQRSAQAEQRGACGANQQKGDADAMKLPQPVGQSGQAQRNQIGE